MDKRNLGKLGEDLAKNFLLKKGYQIIEQNYKVRQGEIDIIARQKNCLVFVEVKCRSSRAFGYPEEGLNYYKKLKFLVAIERYVISHQIKLAWRADLIAIEIDLASKKAYLSHFQAIELE